MFLIASLSSVSVIDKIVYHVNELPRTADTKKMLCAKETYIPMSKVSCHFSRTADTFVFHESHISPVAPVMR
jgi:hypothetical protein